jgi:hypothetical protein
VIQYLFLFVFLLTIYSYVLQCAYNVNSDIAGRALSRAHEYHQLRIRPGSQAQLGSGGAQRLGLHPLHAGQPVLRAPGHPGTVPLLFIASTKYE